MIDADGCGDVNNCSLAYAHRAASAEWLSDRRVIYETRRPDQQSSQ